MTSILCFMSSTGCLFEEARGGTGVVYPGQVQLLLEMVPRYHEVSVSEKGALLDEIAAQTGYARRYAMWLLNHPELLQPHLPRRRQAQYGPEVQHALFLSWHAADRICSKRL